MHIHRYLRVKILLAVGHRRRYLLFFTSAYQPPSYSAFFYGGLPCPPHPPPPHPSGDHRLRGENPLLTPRSCRHHHRAWRAATDHPALIRIRPPPTVVFLPILLFRAVILSHTLVGCRQAVRRLRRHPPSLLVVARCRSPSQGLHLLRRPLFFVVVCWIGGHA